jgi:cytochrome oxidase Cu insertion factor (SCO1/SenC/PrrC family)
MKNCLLIMLCFLSLQTAFSQDEVPPYKQNKNIPSFELQQVNNNVFQSSKLKKNVPVVIMFFSPGCDHCIHQFEDMVKRMNDLKKYQIIMATYQPIEELAEFNKKYQISRYPHIITGRDTKYFFPPFYEISNFPHMAFYNKQGKLTGTFEGNMSVDNMLKRLK